MSDISKNLTQKISWQFTLGDKNKNGRVSIINDMSR
jgi:hypothetical protein